MRQKAIYNSFFTTLFTIISQRYQRALLLFQHTYTHLTLLLKRLPGSRYFSHPARIRPVKPTLADDCDRAAGEKGAIKALGFQLSRPLEAPAVRAGGALAIPRASLSLGGFVSDGISPCQRDACSRPHIPPREVPRKRAACIGFGSAC